MTVTDRSTPRARRRRPLARVEEECDIVPLEVERDERRDAYAPPPPPPPLFRGRPFWPWYDPWWYGPSWWWYDPLASDRYYYARPDVSDIYAEALLVGSIRPRARAQGFIYFPRLPTEVHRITISIRYKRSGETISREAVFPFLLQGNVGPQ